MHQRSNQKSLLEEGPENTIVNRKRQTVVNKILHRKLMSNTSSSKHINALDNCIFRSSPGNSLRV
jgi:hypothetical protein